MRQHMQDQGQGRPERLAYTMPEAAALLGVSTWLLYEMARRKELPVVRLGRRVLISRVALEHLLAVQQGEAADSALRIVT